MNATKNDPFQFMLSNIELIIIAINNSKTLSEAWIKLTSQLSNLKEVMKFNTFKVYSKILVKIFCLINEYKNSIMEFKKERLMLIKKIDEMMIVKSSLKQQLTNTVQKEKEYLHEIDKVNQELDKTRQLLDKKDVENTNLKNELDKVRHNCNCQEIVDENQNLKKQLSNALKENDKIKMYVKEVRQKLDKVSIEKSSMKENHVKKNRKSSETSKSYSKTITTNDVPKRIDGWGVQFNWPYYRLFKRINGKVRWIYIGKDWNEDLAVTKINEFQSKQLGSNNGR
jgi:chromosome segregation ATPase